MFISIYYLLLFFGGFHLFSRWSGQTSSYDDSVLVLVVVVVLVLMLVLHRMVGKGLGRLCWLGTFLRWYRERELELYYILVKLVYKVLTSM